MKKLLVIVITVSAILSSGINKIRVSAAQRPYPFACVVTDDAVLYADASLSLARFTLPKSYFVKIVETAGEITRVTYFGESTSLPLIEGYVKTVCLKFVDYAVKDPYPNLTLSVEADDVLFSDAAKTRPRCVLSKGSFASFVGEYEIGGEIYTYVYALGSVGYVKRSSFSEYELPLHPDFVVETEQSYESADAAASSAAEQPKTDNVRSAAPSQVIIIALLIVGVLCVVFLLFRPERERSANNAFFRDDD